MISSSANKLAIIFIMASLMSILCIPIVNAAPVMDIDYPVNADATRPIHIFTNITSDLPVAEVMISYINPFNNIVYYEDMELVSGNETNGTWTFEIPPQLYEGMLEVSISASDISGDSTPTPAPKFNINLLGPEPAKPFPWNIVLIVGFLAVTLIATELVFKPGFYRPTGRQKARALEEEDRKLELEGGSEKVDEKGPEA